MMMQRLRWVLEYSMGYGEFGIPEGRRLRVFVDGEPQFPEIDGARKNSLIFEIFKFSEDFKEIMDKIRLKHQKRKEL